MDLGAVTEAVIFYLFAAIAVLGALGVVLARSPVRSALALALVFVSLAVMYVLLNAPFLAVAQVMIYAGAVLILFLFVIMVLNPRLDLLRGLPVRQSVAAGGAALVFVAIMALVLVAGRLAPATGPYTPEFVAQQGHVQIIGTLLYSQFLLPFEIASVLLLIAIAGAMTVARREKTAYDLPEPGARQDH